MKTFLIIATSFISLSLFSQGKTGIHYVDVEINSPFDLSFLDSIQALVIADLDSRDYVAVHEPHILRYYQGKEYKARIETPHIPTNSYRIYMAINREFNKLSVIGYAQNIVYNKKLEYVKGNEITKEPLFVVPLIQYKEILNGGNYERLCSTISRFLITKLVDENIYFFDKNHIPTYHVLFESYPTLKQFIDPIPFLMTGISAYSYPDMEYQLSQEDVYSYPDSKLSYKDSSKTVWETGYTRDLLGLSFAMDFESTIEENQIGAYVSVITINMMNTYIGMNFLDEDHLKIPKENFYNFKYHKEKIIWFRSEEFLTHMNDPIFGSGIEFLRAERLLQHLNILE